jgi:hypothetical protein
MAERESGLHANPIIGYVSVSFSYSLSAAAENGISGITYREQPELRK